LRSTGSAVTSHPPPAATAGERRAPALPVRGASLVLVFVCLALGGVAAMDLRVISVAHGAPLPWSTLFASTLPRWLLLAATLPLALRLAARQSFRSARRTVVLTHLALFLAISWSHAAVMAWTIALANPISLLFPWSARLMRAWYGAMPTMVALYGAVLAAAWALHEAREREQRSVRASQLEAQLGAAHLAVLRARLQPHFLYNTLNGIAALVTDRETAKAVTAIEQLAALLHAALRDDGREVVTLRDEVALAERYLMLQQMRFGDRLRHSVSLAPEVADTPVPVLLLQPIVENAVVHGLEAGQATLHVVIAARPLDGAVELRVENDGTALDAPGRADGHGIGLAATRARLSTAFGEHASLEMLPRGAGGVVVQVILPAPVPGAPVPGAPPP
jgi:two-component system LytT family sensor kinase